MPVAFTMPKLSPTMEEGTITKWHKKEGDEVKSDEILLEVATDKATVEHRALDGGILRKILVAEGQEAKVNQPIAVFSEAADEPIDEFLKGLAPKKEMASPKEDKEEKREPPQVSIREEVDSFDPEPPLTTYHFPFSSSQETQKASPLAKKIAREKGIDLQSVRGTGPGGRVTSKDLELSPPSFFFSSEERSNPKLPPGSYQEVPLSPMRKAIAKRLQEAKRVAPHIYVSTEVDATPLTEAHEQLKRGGVKLSFNDFVLRGVALSLKKHPEINSGFYGKKQTLLRFQTIDISVAVSIEGGLITPIIRHADYKSVLEIGKEVKELAKRAKEGKLKREEYQGGSFTVSNMGMYGVSQFCAILNPPQSSILAVGAIEPCVRKKGDHFEEGKKMTCTLSSDHRCVDGSDAASFLKTLRFFLENPALLLL